MKFKIKNIRRRCECDASLDVMHKSNGPIEAKAGAEIGSIWVECSACGAHCDIDVVDGDDDECEKV